MGEVLTEYGKNNSGAVSEVKGPPPTEENLKHLSHQLGHKVGEVVSEISDTSAKYVRTGRDYVKENPGKSVGIAAALGLALGSLITLALGHRGKSGDKS